MNTRWTFLILAVVLAAVAGCQPDKLPAYFDTDTTCDLLGPGELPLGGSGRLHDPYRMETDVQYAGCAKPNTMHGPIYGVVVPPGSYEITQSNAHTDMRLLFYDEDGIYVGAIDQAPGGIDESVTTANLPDTAFAIEVANKDSGDGPFSLIVTTLP